MSLEEEEEGEHDAHGAHGEHGGHHTGYEKGHVWHTDTRFFNIVPECCDHPSIHEEHTIDWRYNQPCTMDEASLEPFAHFGHAKVCDDHDMMDAQTATHNLNVWVVMLSTILWMMALIYGAETLKTCGGVHHEHGGHGHDEHGHDEDDSAHDAEEKTH